MRGEIIKQYTEARINERLHLFLQFPDLRRSFQEIDRKDLAFQKPSLRERHEKVKYSLDLLLLRGVYHRIPPCFTSFLLRFSTPARWR